MEPCVGNKACRLNLPSALPELNFLTALLVLIITSASSSAQTGPDGKPELVLQTGHVNLIGAVALAFV